MITITGNEAEIRFPWPTNDTGKNQAVLKAMSAQVASAMAGQSRKILGGVKFKDITRTETGFEFVFTANLEPLEVPSV